MKKAKRLPAKTPPPMLDAEVAHRLRDPFEVAFDGVLRSNDPLLLERGGGPAAVALYRDLKRDGAVYKAFQSRVLALVARPWRVEPAEDGEAGLADAEIVAVMLKRAGFDQFCREMMEALMTGYAVAEIVWGAREGYIVPVRVVKRAPQRFVFVQEEADTPPALRLLTREAMLKGEALPERKFIVHRHNPEDDNPYGTGLGLQLYWPVYFKRRGVVAWNKLNDRFGAPTPWGRYPASATPKERGTLFDALRAMSNDGAVMTQEGMSIELLEAKVSGTVSSQQQLCEYMDDWISGVLLGTEPRSKSGGALGAASKERADVRLDLVQADSDLLSDTLNATLVRWICEFNGLSPCLVSRVIAEEEDLKALAEADKLVSEMGFRPTLEAVRARYGEGWEAAPAPAPASFSEPVAQASSLPRRADQMNEQARIPDRSRAQAPALQDALDDLVDADLAQWEQDLTPLLAPIQAALADSIEAGETAAQFLERLPGLLADLDADPLAQRLTRQAFTARLAGVAGIEP